MTAPQHPQRTSQVNNEPHSRVELSGFPSDRKTTARSRVGGLWVAAILFALVLLLLLIFLLQNGQRAEVSFFGAQGQLPMGVALLLAAVFGVLLVALPGTARIMQLKTRRERGTATERPAAPPRVTGESANRL